MTRGPGDAIITPLERRDYLASWELTPLKLDFSRDANLGSVPKTSWSDAFCNHKKGVLGDKHTFPIQFDSDVWFALDILLFDPVGYHAGLRFG